MNQYEEAAKQLDLFYENNIEKIESRKNCTEKELQDLFDDFQNQYSPRKLREIDKYSVIGKIFDPEQKTYTENAMIAKLIQEGDDSLYGGLGHAGKQYPNNLMIFKSNGVWKIGRGFENSGETVTYEQAADFVYTIKNQLCDLLIPIADDYFDSFDKYQEFAEKLKKILPVHAWTHKYLHMIYPYAFSEFQTADYKKALLYMFDIKPINGNDQILLAGQVAEITRRMRHNHFFNVACTVYTIPGFKEAVSHVNDRKEQRDAKFSQLKNRLQEECKKKIIIHAKPYDYAEEAQYAENVNQCQLEDDYSGQYIAEPEEKKYAKEIDSFRQYPRDPMKAQIALKRAHYHCEYNDKHWSFIRGADGNKYMEAHHLIPVSQGDLFEYSLDVPANIISLCSTCHNCIHYGTESEKRAMLNILYEQRKSELKDARIEISNEDLLKMYI